MARDTAFNTINALSCHSIPTIIQPMKPMFAIYKFIGNIFAEVKSMATISIILLAHLIYHDLSCNGVTFLNTLDEFNAFIFSSNFSLIGSIVLISSDILYCVLFVHLVNIVVASNECCTLGHIFQSSCTNICTSTSNTTQYVFQFWSYRSSVRQTD